MKNHRRCDVRFQVKDGSRLKRCFKKAKWIEGYKGWYCAEHSLSELSRPSKEETK